MLFTFLTHINQEENEKNGAQEKKGKVPKDDGNREAVIS